jgi:hypothetical protein
MYYNNSNQSIQDTRFIVTENRCDLFLNSLSLDVVIDIYN